jgi:hypothetical protein
VEAIERRVAWVAVTLAIVFAFTRAGIGLSIGDIAGWELVVYIIGTVSLGAAAVLLVGAMAPEFVRPFTLEEGSRFVFLAFALVAVSIVAAVVLSTHAGIEAYRHPNG